MALATELVNAGFSPGQAAGIGGQTNAGVTAAGSTIADATPIKSSMAIVAGANGTTGVILTGQNGDEVWIFNNTSSTLKVYPDSSTSAISVAGTGLGTPGAAFSHLTFKSAIYKRISSTQWFVNVTA